MAARATGPDKEAACAGNGCSKEGEERPLASPDERTLAAQSDLNSVIDSAGPRPRRISPEEDTFDPENPSIRREIVSMIVQYLQSEGYTSAMMTLQDEADVSLNEQFHRQQRLVRVRRAIREGNWPEVEKLCSKRDVKDYKSLLYAVYKQQFLENVEHNEHQKAYKLLSKLKPLESYSHASSPREFVDLCYLLTCRSVQEAPSFASYQGYMHGRQQLMELFEQESRGEGLFAFISSVNRSSVERVAPNRLVNLLQQAVAYQMEFSRYFNISRPKATTLLEDYSCLAVPNSRRRTLCGHCDNVKCVAFVGRQGTCMVSGSSDCTLRLWRSETGECCGVMQGHRSRIWDVSCDRDGRFVWSASGDATVKLWDLHGASRDSTADDRATSSSFVTTTAVVAAPSLQSFAPRATYSMHQSDVYCIKLHHSGTHFASGGYDRSVQLVDINTQQVVRTLTGHDGAVCSVGFNCYGNFLVSGGKDSTIRFWDIMSRSCVQTLSTLGEVTSVEVHPNGQFLLSGSKDNSNRLWDIRMSKAVVRYKGHQNTSKNFIRCRFGPNQSMVLGGSEDGAVYLWDLSSAKLVQRLTGHQGIVYSVDWNAHSALLASCSHDSTVKTWWYVRDSSLVPMERPEARTAAALSESERGELRSLSRSVVAELSSRASSSSSPGEDGWVPTDELARRLQAASQEQREEKAAWTDSGFEARLSTALAVLEGAGLVESQSSEADGASKIRMAKESPSPSTTALHPLTREPSVRRDVESYLLSPDDDASGGGK